MKPEITNEACTCRGAVAKVTKDSESYLFEDLRGWSNRRYMPENCARMFIQLKRVWQERLCAISEEDAQKEGFLNRDQFLNYWAHLHHGGFYDPTNGRIYFEEKKIDCDVWVHEFDVADRQKGPMIWVTGVTSNSRRNEKCGNRQ